MRTKVKMEKSNCRQKCFVCDVFLHIVIQATMCSPQANVQFILSPKQGLDEVSLSTKYTGRLLYHFIYLSSGLALI